jgi:hypothetical protein
MKIAILISGQPRFRVPFEKLLENLKGYEQADWFFYLWDKSLPRHPDHPHIVTPSWQNIISADWASNAIKKALPPDHQLIGLELGDNNIVEPRGAMYSQFTSLFKVDQLRQDSKNQYDLIVRIRLDSQITSIVELLDIKLQIDEDPRLIFTPDNCRHFFHQYGMCDHVAITSPANMKIYTDLVNHMQSHIDAGVDSQAESLLNYHLISNGLTLKEIIPYYPTCYPIDAAHSMWL